MNCSMHVKRAKKKLKKHIPVADANTCGFARCMGMQLRINGTYAHLQKAGQYCAVLDFVLHMFPHCTLCEQALKLKYKLLIILFA